MKDMTKTIIKVQNRRSEKSFAGALKKEWKNIDSQKFISTLRNSDKKNETRFKELKKHWK